MRPSHLVKGFDESLAGVKKQFEVNGPFDGILAFSQGAAMAAIILSMMENGCRWQLFAWHTLIKWMINVQHSNTK